MITANLSPTATQALLQWRSRQILPTGLGSADLRRLGREVTERAVFSARVTNAEFLGELAQVIDDMLDGKINMATGRLRLFRKLKELGYDPEVGFPEEMGKVPPAERGSIQDLSSVGRLNLMLTTNERMAVNYGRMVDGNTPYARHAYPAWELVRLYRRVIERGSPESHSPGWEERWEAAGALVDWQGAVSHRMIARKDSPIWRALGAGAGGYQDTLDNPYPPFAFNSGMAWRAVGRAECIELGLIEEDETPEEMEGDLLPGAAEINAVFDRLPPDLREALDREIGDYNSLRSGNAGRFDPALHPRGDRGRFARKGQGRSREHRTRGQDQFGHLPDAHGRIRPENNIARGHRAIRFLRQPGQRVEKAMFRPDVGWVGMEYGKPDHETGWGNSHIESKHGKAALSKVPEIIQRGQLYPHQEEDGKRYLVHGDHILILKRTSRRQAWTVTSFEDPSRIKRIRKAHGQKAEGGNR
jgi:hypothetical protein